MFLPSSALVKCLIFVDSWRRVLVPACGPVSSRVLTCPGVAVQRHIFASVEDAVNALLAYTFENYKSLDEDAPRGVIEAHMLTPNYQPTSAGSAAPALAPAVQLYALLHDILSAKVQDTLRTHLQVRAARLAS